MARYAASTTVDSGASRAEIERTLQRYGCDEFGYGIKAQEATILFTLHGRRVRFTLPLPGPDDEAFWRTPSRGQQRTPTAAREAWEQATRQRWRALLLCIKAKLESVEAEIETYEAAFLAHFVLPGGGTVGERIVPELDGAWRGRSLPPLMGPPTMLILSAPVEIDEE